MVVLSNKPERKLGLATLVFITIVVSTLTSLATTTAALKYLTPQQVLSIGTEVTTTKSQATNIECGAQVYSPVQNKCVDQSVFDREMKALFKALGIDTSIYQTSTN